MFNTIVRWFVLSSANPAEVSLTVKGALIGVLPVLMAAAGLAHFNVGQDQLTGIFDVVAGLVQVVLTIVAALVTAYGLVRKLWNTIKVHQAQQ
jgi:hypothetical protein